jgi:hypothetical protein
VYRGGGIFSYRDIVHGSTDLNIINSIVRNNTHEIDDTGEDLYSTGYEGWFNNIMISHSDIASIFGNYSSDGTNLDVDPLFVDPVHGDYHLTSASPLIDAGTNASAPTSDIYGNLRPYDGDGDGTAKADIGAVEYAGAPRFAAPFKIGVVRGNTWFLDKNGNGGWEDGIDLVYNFGVPGVDIWIAGDWSGGGSDKIGVVRGNTWFLDMNGSGTWDDGIDGACSFGIPGDVPIVGDWNGDGRTKIGVVRVNTWFLDANGNGLWDDGIDAAYSFGIPGDVPIVGDWNGDGRTKIGVVRGNTWYLDANGNGLWDDGIDLIYSFGVPGLDIWITGDWNDDGKTEIGVVRGNTWFLDMNGNGGWDDGIDAAYSFGVSGDIPIVGRW